MPLHNLIAASSPRRLLLNRRHIAITRSAGKLKFYVEGFPVPGTLDAGTLPFKALAFASEGGSFSPVTMYNTAVKEEDMRRFFRNKYHDGHKVERVRISSDWENAVRKGIITPEKFQFR